MLEYGLPRQPMLVSKSVISMELSCVIQRYWGIVVEGSKRFDEAVTIGLLEDPCSASASMHTNGRGPTTYLVRCAFRRATMPVRVPTIR